MNQNPICTTADTFVEFFRWHDTVRRTIEDFKEIYFQIPEGAPLEMEIRGILTRLELVNRQAAASLEELRQVNVYH